MAQHRWQHRVGSVLVTILLAGFVPVAADISFHPKQYVGTVWQSEQGLPQNSVFDIVQDHRGYLWLATWGALVRFDGARFTSFSSAALDLRGQLTSVFESRSGDLWVGTTNGLNRVRDEAATRYTERDGLPGNFIRSIREDRDGKIWVNTSRGVDYFDGQRLTRYPAHRGKAVDEFLLQARDGSMWFRREPEITRYGADGSVEASVMPGAYRAREAGDGSVWIAFHDKYRVVRYHRGVFSDVQLPKSRRPQWTGLYPHHGAVGMATDTNGELLLLTPAGLVRVVDGKLSAPETLPLPPTVDEIPNVRSFTVDREGNRWVGTLSSGLFRFRPAPLTAYGKDQGLSNTRFVCVFQDRDGRIWLGGDFLYWYDGHEFHRLPDLTDIRSIAQTPDGDMWFGGSGGLYRWRSGVLHRFNIEAPAVNGILVGRDGAIWVVEQSYDRPGGLYRFHDGALELTAGFGRIGAVAEDRDGGLWMKMNKPLELHYRRAGRTVVYNENAGVPSAGIEEVYLDRAGTVWLVGASGLSFLRNGRFNTITARDGLPNEELISMLDDGKGNVWLSSNHGIFRLSREELNDFVAGRVSAISPVSYGVGEGMKSSECNWGTPAVLMAHDGRIWFPTIRGVVAVDPHAGDRHPPTVLVEEARAKKMALALGRRSSVPPGDNTLDFRFTALSLSAPEKLTFKYRLEPYDKDWVDAGTRRTAHYTNMPPGDYSFRVIAANNYGIWNDQGASVSFVLQPHFYQTNWFRALGGVVFLTLLWLAYQLRLRHLERDLKKLEDVIETIPAMAWTALPDGSIEFANQRWADYTGLSAKETAGSGWTAVLHPDDRHQHEPEWRACLASGQPFEFEARFRSAGNGEYRWLLARGVPFRDKHGKIVRWHGILTDIEDRKRAEQTLRESETRFRTFVNNVADAILVQDEHGVIVDVNGQGCEALGYTRQEVVGAAPLASFCLKTDQASIEMERVAERTAVGETVLDRHWHRRKDGTQFPVEVHATVFSYGGRRFLLKVVRDISETLRAEEAVRDSEKHLRDVIDSIPAQVWSASPDGLVDFVNQRSLEFTGTAFEQSLGVGWQDSVHPEDVGPLLESVRAGVASGQPIEFEARMRRADGEYRWLLFRSVPVCDETGKVVKWFGVSTDIDDSKRADDALSQSQAYLAEAQRLSHTGSWALDVISRKYVYVSEEDFRIWGIDPQAGLPSAETVLERIHPDDRQRWELKFRQCLGANADSSDEYRIVLPDGTVKYLHTIRHPVSNSAGEIVRLVGTTMDITDRKRAEEARAYLASIVECSEDAIIGRSLDGIIQSWNRGAERLYGYTAQEAIGRPIAMLIPPDRAHEFVSTDRLDRGEQIDELETVRIGKDGRRIDVSVIISPMKDASGHVVGAATVARDITDRKRAEEERERLRTELAHINRVSMMGELAASIAHEVNQPLSGVVSNGGACLRWLAANPPNLNEARESVRRIVGAGKHAAEVIARIRSMTKRAAAPKEKLNLNETIGEVLVLAGDEARKNRVVVRTQFARDLPLVSGDRVQLQQVVLNLVMNAIEAMSSVTGRIRELVISTRRLEDNQVQATVQDSGIGLEPNTMSKIFESFYTTKPGGMGMGLSISRSIVESHGGRLWATANDGPGTALHFSLPKYHDEDANATAATV